LAQLERNTRDLQESVMSIRMMPISFVFSRFPRVVRDLSGKLGKQVELKTTGETTELDKSLIERIADPLTHLIRNSLDHGIESAGSADCRGQEPGRHDYPEGLSPGWQHRHRSGRRRRRSAA
jgi:two-component system chemotaxis sensor kinase CheA